MPLSAIGLLLGSAILHTTWNLLVKRAGEKSMVTWWGMLVGSALFLPAVVLLGLPERSTWVLVLLSAVAGAAFFVVLPYAYNDTDFSLVYPMARGAAPAMIVAWSVLFLGESPTRGGLLGLAVIVAGLMIVGGSGLLADQSSGITAIRLPDPETLKGIGPALMLALLISIYSVIDGAAVKRTDPLPYAAFIYLVSAIYMTPYVLKRHGWKKLKGELASNPWRVSLIGVLIVTAYMLALWAYRLSSVSYAGAIREVNVVFGALAGWLLLGEKFGAVRVTGAAVIFAGIVLIAVLG